MRKSELDRISNLFSKNRLAYFLQAAGSKGALLTISQCNLCSVIHCCLAYKNIARFFFSIDILNLV